MIQDLYIECVFESSISSQSFILSLLLKVHAKYNNIRRAGGFFKMAFVRTLPNLLFLWHKGWNLGAITGECWLAVPINFSRGISAAKSWTPLDSFSSHLVSFSWRCYAPTMFAKYRAKAVILTSFDFNM